MYNRVKVLELVPVWGYHIDNKGLLPPDLQFRTGITLIYEILFVDLLPKLLTSISNSVVANTVLREDKEDLCSRASHVKVDMLPKKSL